MLTTLSFLGARGPATAHSPVTANQNWWGASRCTMFYVSCQGSWPCGAAQTQENEDLQQNPRSIGNHENGRTPICMTMFRRLDSLGWPLILLRLVNFRARGRAPAGREQLPQPGAPPLWGFPRPAGLPSKASDSRRDSDRPTNANRQTHGMLPLALAVLELPGPAGRASGVDFGMASYSLEGPAPRRGAARGWALLAVKRRTEADPGPPLRPRKLFRDHPKNPDHGSCRI